MDRIEIKYFNYLKICGNLSTCPGPGIQKKAAQ